MKLLLSYDEVQPESLPLVGGKGENTAILYKAGYRVPRGYILTSEAFRNMLVRADVGVDLNAFLSRDINQHELGVLTERLRTAVVSAALDDDTMQALQYVYDRLIETTPVGLIVRSSANVEDTPNASLAGLLSSFPDIREFEDLVLAVRRCWASIFTTEAHIYLKEQGLLAPGIAVAVLVQTMVPAERSGIIFSMDPVTGDTDKVIIDAIFGFGEEIVSGEVTPERYVYSRKRDMIVSRKMGRQAEFITPSGERKPVLDEIKSRPKLSDREVYELAQIGINLDELFGKPQDIEWAFADGAFYILQSRPIVIGERYEKLFPQIGEHTVLLRGTGVSPAVGSGRVMLISPDTMPDVDCDTVVVAQRITNELAVYLRRAAAVVTDEGGATSHGANILREFGVPCVLGTGNATEKLKEGQVVTVDGLRGVVYAGDLSIRVREVAAVPETRTQIFLSVLIPEKVRNLASFADGVSSLRDDYFLFESGVHPIKMIREGLGIYLEDSITNGIVQTLTMFDGKPVWYKTMDAPTDEFRRLQGSEDPEERNPLFGWRGIGRELEEPEMLKLEFRALKRALAQADGDLGVKLSFVRVVDELVRAKEVLLDVGLRPHEDIKVGISVENPAAVFMLAEFINEGIDFISVGLSDLVMCALAIDRESQKVADLFQPSHPAVLRLLDEIAAVAQRYGVFTCVAGESARDPAILPYLVNKGFDAVGVSLSFFSEVKSAVASIERDTGTFGSGRSVVGL
ncbi:MAG TPA: PEP/pyruvate-binding domain-containing protein [Candidatus Aquicultor sp.]|jgi:pyruvate,water dikinase